MTIDPRTPVIVGGGQINDRELGSEPIDLMVRCTEAALADTGAPSIRSHVDAIRVVWGIWPYKDPGRLVADRIGRPSAATSLTTVGGNQVYDLLIDTGRRIAAGEIDAAAVCAAETMRTRRADRARGADSSYLPEKEGAVPDSVIGSSEELSTAREVQIGMHQPARFYAMAETAIRHRRRESIEEHHMRIVKLWRRASEIAAANPHAWISKQLSESEIGSITSENRPIASPYPKLLTSNPNVDQGGAIIMCSAEVAQQSGVPRDRWVFPWSGSGASDHIYPTIRWALDESPALRLSGTTALGHAGIGLDECALLDLYSCFPAAVQVAQRELGIAPERDFTITGGLTFAGGPRNCYCILALTRAVELLRSAPEQRAFLTGNGGYFSKHSAIVLAGTPPPQGFRSSSPQAKADALPRRPIHDQPRADATLETYTVTYDREMRPERAILACFDETGARHWAETHDDQLMNDLLAHDRCGSEVSLDGSVVKSIDARRRH